MAMSSLAAQLAGLADSHLAPGDAATNKNVGSTLPANLRHDEAIGRGVHHSVAVGHSLTMSGNAAFKPSVIYDNAKAASDIPLTTLWENCRAALMELSQDVYPPLRAYVAVCQDSLMQRSSTKSTSLTQLLTILATLYPHDSDACLHILEYLIRRYNIHVTAADTLLMTVLPHAETLPVLFHRVLQLVNIAANVGTQSCWLWLRPYARPASKSGGGRPPPPPRHVVAKHAIPNTALLHQVCTLSQNVAKLSVDNDSVPHRGLSQILSWSATLIVSGLVQLQKTYESSNPNLESVLRSLLPFVFSATSGSSGEVTCRDWTVWGHILASALSETMELAPTVQQVLCSSILKGALADVPTTNILNETTVAHTADALVAVMAVCVPLASSSNATNSLWNATRDSFATDLWLPLKVFPQILQLQDLLLPCLQYLHSTRNINVGDLVANLILLSVLHSDQHSDQNLMVGLLEADGSGGLEEIWKSTDGLSQHLAEWLVWTYLNDTDATAMEDEKAEKETLNFYQELLQALRRIDPKGCERGMAEAMQEEADAIRAGRAQPQHSTKQHKNKLAVLLGGFLPVQEMARGKGGGISIKDGKAVSAKASSSTWLPPHVALEHADPSLRLQAIKQLLKEHQQAALTAAKKSKDQDDNSDEDDDDDVVMHDTVDDDLESLESSLSRRMASDDDTSVVLAAARALATVLAAANKPVVVMSQTVANDIVTTLYSWSSFAKPEKKLKGELMQHRQIMVECLKFLGYAQTDDDDQRQRTWEAATAHISHWDSEIAQAAAASIVKLLPAPVEAKGKSPKKSKPTNSTNKVIEAKQLLLAQHDFGASLLSEDVDSMNGNSKDTEVALALRRRCVWILLDIRAASVKSYKPKKNQPASDDDDVSQQSLAAVEACLFLLSSEAEVDTWTMNPERANSLKDAWRTTIKTVPTEKLSDLLLSLASASKTIYDSIGKELVQVIAENITDKNGAAVSVYSVLMEASLQEHVSNVAVKRLVGLTVAYLQEGPANNKKHPASWYCVIPALALLEHADEEIRLVTLRLLSVWSEHFSTQKSHAKWQPLQVICQEVVKNKASATMGGATFLPKCLAAASKKSQDCRDLLLNLVLCAAVACGSETAQSSSDITKSMWLTFGQGSGQANAAVALLRAMELSGEKAFPLKLRWEVVGAQIQTNLLGPEAASSELPAGLLLLLDAVVEMLKGASVANATSLLETVVISMGPGSSGRRQRSYSVGKADGVTYLDPYPKSMSDSLVKILGQAGQGGNLVVQRLCKAIVGNVLGRGTWAESVFKKLAVTTKRKIAAELLSMLADSTSHFSIEVFLALPLDAADVCHLKKEADGSPDELVAVSILADYIRSNNQDLMDSPGSVDLVRTLFTSISNLSSMEDDDDDVEYVRQSLLSATLELLSNQNEGGTKLKTTEKEVSGWVDLLLSLNGDETSDNTTLVKDVRPLVTQRAKTAALSLLTALCSTFPKAVVKSLIPAMTAQIRTMEEVTSEESMQDLLQSTFDSILPVYWKHASSANLSFGNLLSAFTVAARAISSETKRQGIYNCFIQALSDFKFEGSDDPSMGAVLAFFIAGEVHELSKDEANLADDLQAETEFALRIMEDTTGASQVSSILLLLHYADTLLLLLQSKKGQKDPSSSTTFEDPNSTLPTTLEVLQIALAGSPVASGKKALSTDTAKSQRAIKKLVQMLLLAVNDALLTEPVRKFIRRSDRNNTSLSLRLWQDLLVLQSTASQTAAASGEEESAYWETTIRVAGESLEHIQASLPLPTFLASATSLIKDAETDELRAGAIRLVADRAPEVRPGTPEAQLFLEMAALLVDILRSPDKHSSTKEGSSSLQQSALVAIEHIARSHHTVSSSQAKSNPSGGTQTFLSALQGCADIFVQICGQGKNVVVNIGEMDDASRQLLCSAALCTATLVRVTAPRCIALLPKFMNQLVACLAAVNDFVASTAKDQDEVIHESRTIQVCVLRALTSVADSVPQFIFPYLKFLLDPAALPSGALRSDPMEQAVISAVEALEKSLSAQVPARVILPVVSKAISSVANPEEFDVLLKLMKNSIDVSSGEELVGHLGSILKAVTTTYDFDCEHMTRLGLLDAANGAVLALVMKLSENHLRRLYESLRDWRGALVTEDPDKFALRRFAFWKVSAVLGKELRTIYLSCLTTVITDAIDELNLVVSHLCNSKKSARTPDGKKKRRLDENDDDASQTTLSSDAMLSIQPILSCLEFALRADAQGGGRWIRTDDGQRYRSLLEPMGKLLQAKVPSNYPVVDGEDAESPFYQLVLGGDEAASGSGSVVDCLTALAGAVGNEQMWKPLNYAILDACGNRGRSEVRKAGLECLLSVMRALGEEYMVLLPECLPILSELLEDNDEEVAGLAQDCISLGEDLLGESLEDNLR